MFPITSMGMYAPMVSQSLWKGATMRTNPIRNNESSLEHCLCPVCCPVYSSGLKIVTMLPSPPPPIHFWNGLFAQISKSIHIPPPPRGNNILAHSTKN